MKPDDAGVQQVVRAILDYMTKYPEAADTEEHIRSWWLSAWDNEQGWQTVTIALQMLERNGLIEHVELPGRRMVYRLRGNSLQLGLEEEQK